MRGIEREDRDVRAIVRRNLVGMTGVLKERL